VKVFTFIFSFYLLALAIKPCSDKDDCKYQDFERDLYTSSDHSDHESDIETCSPFCICACCGQSITNIFYASTFYALVPVVEKVFPIYNASFVSEVYLSIWQPPKIS